VSDPDALSDCAAPKAAPISFWRRHGISLAVLLAATTLTFGPSLDNGFVEWDDAKTLLDNTQYRGLGWTQIKWAFTSFENGHYMPLVWLSWGVDYLIWGADPFGFHLSNLILHVLNAWLVYALAVDLLGRTWSRRARPASSRFGLRFWALLAALLFAVHPLRVESVVWATERKDLLSSLFYLLAVVLYLRADGTRWVLPGLVYVLAALSKVMVVSLPVVLLILDVYPLRRLGGKPGWFSGQAWRVYRQKIPFVLAAAAVTVVAPLAQEYVGSMPSWESHGLWPRLTVCAYGLVFYLVKTLVPWNLAPLYELHYPIEPAETQFLLCTVGVLVAAVAVFLLRRRLSGLATASCCYLVMLMPVLGLVQNGPQIVADRYSYLACVGWVLLICAALGRLSGRGVVLQGAILVVSGMALATLIALSITQSRHWRDTQALWTQALRVDPACAFCYNAMGRALAEEDPAAAENNYRQALGLNPNHADANNNLGILLTEQGHFPEALARLERAVELEPDNGAMHFNYANALGLAGRIDEAIVRYERAAAAAAASPAWKPPASLYNNWAYRLIDRGRYEEAVARARCAVQTDPTYAEGHYNLGVALLRSGVRQGAMDSFQASIRCRPDEPQAYLYAARELARGGLREQAQEILRIGLSRLPDNSMLAGELSRLQGSSR